MLYQIGIIFSFFVGGGKSPQAKWMASQGRIVLWIRHCPSFEVGLLKVIEIDFRLVFDHLSRTSTFSSVNLKYTD